MHCATVRRRRVPATLRPYGYEFAWTCDCGSRSRETWALGDVWPRRRTTDGVRRYVEQPSALELAHQHMRRAERREGARENLRCSLPAGVIL